MKAILHIVKHEWSGRTTEQPGYENYKVEAERGSVLENVSGIGNPSARVKEVKKDYIVLITSELAPVKVGTGIDLSGNYKELETKIKTGETYKFSTQTADMGASYTIALVEIAE